MKYLTPIMLLILLPAILAAQGMPSEQFILWKVWSSDSTALKNLGYGDCIFSARDTVVLKGSDTDTVLFDLSNSRGYFNVWVIPDTANFSVGGTDYNHQAIGATDSLTLSYRPGMKAGIVAANPAIELEYINNLDWEPENAYYETLTPPLTEHLEFYINHTGEADTSVVIIEIQWQ